MDRLEALQSCIGKKFAASPSPFTHWPEPTILSIEDVHPEFVYISWNADKSRLPAKGISNLHKIEIKR